MIWGVVEVDPAQQWRGALSAEHLFEALPPMDVEIVQNQVNLAGPRIAAPEHTADEADEIDLGASGGHLRGATSAEGLDGYEDAAGNGPLVLVVLPAEDTGLGRQGLS